jgi:hypothetical protein
MIYRNKIRKKKMKMRYFTTLLMLLTALPLSVATAKRIIVMIPPEMGRELTQLKEDVNNTDYRRTDVTWSNLKDLIQKDVKKGIDNRLENIKRDFKVSPENSPLFREIMITGANRALDLFPTQTLTDPTTVENAFKNLENTFGVKREDLPSYTQVQEKIGKATLPERSKAELSLLLNDIKGTDYSNIIYDLINWSNVNKAIKKIKDGIDDRLKRVDGARTSSLYQDIMKAGANQALNILPLDKTTDKATLSGVLQNIGTTFGVGINSLPSYSKVETAMAKMK